MKTLLAIIFTILSLPSFAQECASNTAQLKELVGNSALPLTWVENNAKADRRLTLRLSNEGGALGLDLSVPGGNWAHVTGVVCKTGAETFVARVSNMSWGPQAPGLVKFAGKPSQIKLQLPYQSLLKVTAKGMSFDFSPR